MISVAFRAGPGPPIDCALAAPGLRIGIMLDPGNFVSHAEMIPCLRPGQFMGTTKAAVSSAAC